MGDGVDSTDPSDDRDRW